MNLPNTLTIARIFIVPILVAVLVQERIILHWNGGVITNDVVALIIFWVAAATDLLDGYLARRWGQVTTIGTLLDPIADKLLVSAALISLVQERVVPGWLVVLLIGRAFSLGGSLGGLFALRGGLVFDLVGYFLLHEILAQDRYPDKARPAAGTADCRT